MGKSERLRRSKTSVESSTEDNPTDGDLSDKDGSDDPYSSDSETDSNSSSDSGTESNRSSDSTTSTGLSAIIKILSESLLRTEIAEMEMIKAREAARWEAEKKRLEMEVELTKMVFQTHLQTTASLLVGEEKAREAARWEAEKKRLEMEVELTKMVFQTHLQTTASLLVGEEKISPAQRKRKRSTVEEHECSTTREKSLALLGLLQLNLIFWNSLT